MSKYPSIPDVTSDPMVMQAILRAMKESIERLTGQRQGGAKGAPTIFVQARAPSLLDGALLGVGDMWVNDQTDQLAYWSGKGWKRIVP